MAKLLINNYEYDYIVTKFRTNVNINDYKRRIFSIDNIGFNKKMYIYFSFFIGYQGLIIENSENIYIVAITLCYVIYKIF